MKKLLLILSLLLWAATASAGVCTTLITRICQPGKPCRTSETHTDLANSPEECLASAQRFCPVYFTEGVAGKQVRSIYDGQPLQEGQNICR
jgi:hypothetical protein